MDEVSLSVPGYDPRRGVVATAEGGTVTVEVRAGAVEIFGDPAGLRDLARWCLALSDETVGPQVERHAAKVVARTKRQILVVKEQGDVLLLIHAGQRTPRRRRR